MPKHSDFRRTYRAILERLRDTPSEKASLEDHEIFRRTVAFCESNGNPVYTFGFEDFQNLGDQALWASLNRILRQLPDHVRCSGLIPYPAHLKGYQGLTEVYPDGFRQGAVLFPGGGSFGNRYFSSKRRVVMMENLKPECVLQMPVSTSFKAEGVVPLERVGQAYRSIPKTALFVRDIRSQQEALEHMSLNCVLLPDLTNILPDMRDLKVGGSGTLCLVRRDQESKESVKISMDDGIIADWDDVPPVRDLWFQLARRLCYVLASSRLPLKLRYSVYVMRARQWLAGLISDVDTARALAFLAQFDHVVTDRLHGVLLSQKLGIPVSMSDNDHGKISRYLDTWNTSKISSQPVRCFDDLQSAVNSLEKRNGQDMHRIG